MGVHSLWSLLGSFGTVSTPEAWRGKRVAIDASIWIVQFRATDRDDRDMSHRVVEGCLRRILKLLYFGIRPIFVFDGRAPELKRKEQFRRRMAQAQVEQAKIQSKAKRILNAQLASGLSWEQLGGSYESIPPAAEGAPSSATASLHPPRPAGPRPSTQNRKRPRSAPTHHRTQAAQRPPAALVDGVSADNLGNYSTKQVHRFLKKSAVAHERRLESELHEEAQSTNRLSGFTRGFLGPRQALLSTEETRRQDRERMNTRFATAGLPRMQEEEGGGLPGSSSSATLQPQQLLLEEEEETEEESEEYSEHETLTSGDTDDGSSLLVEEYVDEEEEEEWLTVDDESQSVVSVQSDGTQEVRHKPTAQASCVLVVDSDDDDDEEVVVVASDEDVCIVGSQEFDSVVFETVTPKKAMRTTTPSAVNGTVEGTKPEDMFRTPPKGGAESAAGSYRPKPSSLGVQSFPQRASGEGAEGGSGATAVDPELIELIEVLDACGIPYLTAAGEAEAQCAYLNQTGLVDAVLTEDSDTFLFGACTVIRGFFSKGFVKVFHSTALRDAGLTPSTLRGLALLLGSDYTEGVSGVGVVKSLDILAAYLPSGRVPSDEDIFLALSQWAGDVKQLQKGAETPARTAAAGVQELRAADRATWEELPLTQFLLRSAVLEQWAPSHPTASSTEGESKSPITHGFPSWEVMEAYRTPLVHQHVESPDWEHSCEPNWSRVKQLASTRCYWTPRDIAQRVASVQQYLSAANQAEVEQGHQLLLTHFFESVHNREPQQGATGERQADDSGGGCEQQGQHVRSSRRGLQWPLQAKTTRDRLERLTVLSAMSTVEPPTAEPVLRC